jgi:lipoprotein NlpI
MRLWIGFVFLLAGICVGGTGLRADGSAELSICYRLADQGRDDDAVEHCTRAIESGALSRSSLAAAYVDRAFSYRNLRQFDNAIADCGKALAIREDDVNTHMVCGTAYGGKGDYKTGLEHFDRILALAPDNAGAYNNRGNFLNQMGDYAGALKDFDAAIRLKSHYLQAEFNRGVALFNLGRFPDAASALEEAFKTAPDNAYVLLWLTLARRRAEIEMTPQAVIAAAGEIDRHSWPWPVVSYYGGESMDLAKALSLGDQSSAQAISDGKCEGNFYFGEMAIAGGHADEGKAMLHQAADICAKTFIEHAGALAELARQ